MEKKLGECTVWHEIFAGVYFCGLVIFSVLRKLIFATRTHWFFHRWPKRNLRVCTGKIEFET